MTNRIMTPPPDPMKMDGDVTNSVPPNAGMTSYGAANNVTAPDSADTNTYHWWKFWKHW